MNDTKKHTQGPWHIIEQKGAINDCYWIGPEKHMSIAEVRHGAKDEEYGGEEAELANAKLIAAAPDMAEALKFYADVGSILLYENKFLEWGDRNIDLQTTEQFGHKARVALSKAGIA
jgi:hypothetical protein